MLNIDVAVLDLVKSNLSILSDDLAVQSNKIDNIIQDVQSAWQSEYTYMYVQSTEKVQDDISKLSKEVLNISNSIGYISEQVKLAEEEIKGKLN